MKTVNISELRNKLSAILDKLPHLGSVRVMDRSKPIAVIYPLGTAPESRDEERLLSLERAGVITRQLTPLAKELWEEQPPAPLRGFDAVKSLIDERSESL